MQYETLNFMDSPYFVGEVCNWHLKPGAPMEVVEEFLNFMRAGPDLLPNWAVYKHLKLNVFFGGSCILLIIPGRNGSLCGYDGKYNLIAEVACKLYGASVIVASNPGSRDFSLNFKTVMEFVTLYGETYFKDHYEVRFLGNSLGASYGAAFGSDYPVITRKLLINPPLNINFPKVISGLRKSTPGSVTLVFGSRDPCFQRFAFLKDLEDWCRVIVIPGADHHFTDMREEFCSLAEYYLFQDGAELV